MVNLYYLAIIMLVPYLSQLFSGFGIGGAALTQVAAFGLLPLLVVQSAAPGSAYRVFRLRRPSRTVLLHSALLAALGWVVVYGLMAVVQYLLLRLGGQPSNPYEALLDQPYPAWAILTVLAIIPAVAEEFAFRGLVLSGYEQLGPRTAWIVAGLVFAMAHMSIIRLPGLAVLGMLLAYTTLRTGSIWPGVVIHGLHNGITLVLYLLTRTTAPDPALTQDIPTGALLLWLALAVGALPLLLGLARSLPAHGESPAAPPPAGGSGQGRLMGMLSDWWPLGAAVLLFLLSGIQELTMIF